MQTYEKRRVKSCSRNRHKEAVPACFVSVLVLLVALASSRHVSKGYTDILKSDVKAGEPYDKGNLENEDGVAPGGEKIDQEPVSGEIGVYFCTMQDSPARK